MARIKGIQKAIRRMKYRADTFSGRNGKATSSISTIASNSVKRNFNAGGRPKWQKRKKVYPHPILDKTGAMRDSAEASALRWTSSGQGYRLEFVTPEYGTYHQYGTSRLPVRKFVFFQPDEIRRIQDVFRKAFLKK